MSHRDSQGRAVRLNLCCLKGALGWLLRRVDWSNIRFRDDCTWTPRCLATAALFWAWSDELTLIDRFQSIRRIVLQLFPRLHPLAGSYQAFMKMLRRWTKPMVVLLQCSLREQQKMELADCWLIMGFALFAVDGSRTELPRTRSNERAYSPSRKAARRRKARRRNGHSKKSISPQLWLTTMWHVGTGLPWDWRIGPADSSERAHMREMLTDLPDNALVTADAGFVGYDYMQAILVNGRQLLLRVGSNVKILKKLGYAREFGHTVYLWPNRQAVRGKRPLVLRLVVAHNGKHPVYLLTSVLAKARLSDAQVVELYARRWGIELFYRHLKQTFQRRKLRSASAENARVEMEWSLTGLWAMALYALVERRKAGIPEEDRLSIAQTLRAFRRMLRDYLHPTERNHSLRDRLRTATIDPYQRQCKTSRDYPRKKQETPPGPPLIVLATRTQRQQAQSLRRRYCQKG